MAHTSVIQNVGGTNVQVTNGLRQDGSDGRTQTINIFDDTNLRGNYRQVLRLQWGDRLQNPALVERFDTIDDLETFLVARGAIKEGFRRKN